MLKKIAIIVDKKGWIQHDRAKTLKSILPFHISIFTPQSKIKAHRFDRIYYSSISLMNKKRIKHPHILASITSHKMVENKKSMKRLISKCYRCSVNSRILYDIVRKYTDVSYIPNGVDTEFFTFSNKKMTKMPVIGWVGNYDRATKNFAIVKRLKKAKEFKMWIVAKKKSNGKKRNKTQMRDFYHHLDYYLVCSSTEGTPNPALEAASCGVPLLATKVGNMPEIVLRGNTGFFIKNNYNSAYKGILQAVRFSSDTHYEMKEIIREIMVKNWDWKTKIANYKDFFK